VKHLLERPAAPRPSARPAESGLDVPRTKATPGRYLPRPAHPVRGGFDRGPLGLWRDTDTRLPARSVLGFTGPGFATLEGKQVFHEILRVSPISRVSPFLSGLQKPVYRFRFPWPCDGPTRRTRTRLIHQFHGASLRRSQPGWQARELAKVLAVNGPPHAEITGGRRRAELDRQDEDAAGRRIVPRRHPHQPEGQLPVTGKLPVDRPRPSAHSNRTPKYSELAAFSGASGPRGGTDSSRFFAGRGIGFPPGAARVDGCRRLWRWEGV